LSEVRHARLTSRERPGAIAAYRSVVEFLLIAGLWLDGSAGGSVVAPLEEHGHRAVPLALPGQVDGSSNATLDDQIAAVLAAVDALSGHPVVVGHSVAATLAWIAADARPAKVRKVVLIGGFPVADGGAYFDGIKPEDGLVRFPGWGAFEGSDSADLDEQTRQRIASAAIPVPEAVTSAVVHLRDDRRYDIPVTVICPEFSPEQAKEWIEQSEVSELGKAHFVEYINFDSGHWPMFSRPGELAHFLVEVARA
jgi:pimeloyl-ACP methyl ester carboxylesterase